MIKNQKQLGRKDFVWLDFHTTVLLLREAKIMEECCVLAYLRLMACSVYFLKNNSSPPIGITCSGAGPFHINH